MSEKPASFFVDYQEGFLTEEECNVLRDQIHKHYDYIINTFPTRYPSAPTHSLTGRHEFFNWLYIHQFQQILEPKLLAKIKEIKPNCDDVFVQCWVNTFMEGDNMDWHCHRVSDDAPDFTVCHVFLGGANTSTIYMDPDDEDNLVKVKNKKGAFSSIGPDVYHSSTPNLRKDGSVRMSIAIDFYDVSDMDSSQLYDMEKRVWRYKRFKGIL